MTGAAMTGSSRNSVPRWRNVPRGARLLTVLDGNAIGERADQPYWHMAEFAILDRGAFTPLLFTTTRPACGAVATRPMSASRPSRRSRARRRMSTSWTFWRAASFDAG